VPPGRGRVMDGPGSAGLAHGESPSGRMTAWTFPPWRRALEYQASIAVRHLGPGPVTEPAQRENRLVMAGQLPAAGRVPLRRRSASSSRVR
jgi:hypothetical protein